MRTRHLAAAGLAAAAAAAITVPGSAAAPPSVLARPASHFSATSAHVTNPYFPLKPGTRFVYRGEKDGQRSRDIFDATRQTQRIDGVLCRVVHDRLYLRGVLHERTTDWYAQSDSGDVWYFGERTAELDRNGKVVSREGSWTSGKRGARAGVYITARPRVGQTRAQEHFPGHAEDHFKVLDTSAHVTVPLLSSGHAVLTKEWTPLEPAVLDHKFYVRDIGMIREASVKGPVEIGNLVAIRHLR